MSEEKAAAVRLRRLRRHAAQAPYACLLWNCPMHSRVQGTLHLSREERFFCSRLLPAVLPLAAPQVHGLQRKPRQLGAALRQARSASEGVSWKLLKRKAGYGTPSAAAEARSLKRAILRASRTNGGATSDFRVSERLSGTNPTLLSPRKTRTGWAPVSGTSAG